jgi:hypothetical protein
MMDSVKVILSVLAGLAVVLGISGIVLSVLPTPDPSNGNRGPFSVLVYVDDETGIHYVGTPNGGIFPRFQEDGKSIYTEEVKDERHRKRAADTDSL